MINVVYNKSDYEITQRKMELFDKYLKVIQWGRKHPVQFMEKFFGLQFTDHQRYILLSTWTAKFVVWLMSRNSGCKNMRQPLYSVMSIANLFNCWELLSLRQSAAKTLYKSKVQRLSKG